MLFSLIVPFYNVEKYILKCLESIESQDCRDFEVILVDDGSLDSTSEIVNIFIDDKQEQYKVIKQKNSGLSGARNTGLKYAAGQYVIFIDSDDWIDSNYLSTIKTIIEKCSPDIIRCKWYEDSETQKIASDISDSSKTIDKIKTFENIISDNYGAQVWKNAYKASLWQGVEFPVGMLYEDLYTTHIVFDLAQTVYFCNQAFYHYMIRSGSISTSAKFGRAKGIYYGFKSRYEFLCNHNEYSHLKSTLIKKVLNNLVQYIHECVKFNTEINAAKSECKSFLVEAKKENFKILKSAKMEILLFLKMSVVYKIAYKLLRG